MMSNVPKEMIDEAAKRGIVPGAIILCAAGGYEASVLPYSQWTNEGWGENYIFMDPPPCLGPWIYHNGEWATVIVPATVITPAPAKEEEGLKEGDACECGPAMRAAIVELAKELGLRSAYIEDKETNGVGALSNLTICDAKMNPSGWPNLFTPEVFIAKMRVTAKKPKPIKIKVGEGVNSKWYEVEFCSGSIKVGCTSIDNTTVRVIASKLIDQ